MAKQRVTYLSHYHYGDKVRVIGHGNGWIDAVTFTCDENGPVVLYDVVTNTCLVKKVRRESLIDPTHLHAVP